MSTIGWISDQRTAMRFAAEVIRHQRKNSLVVMCGLDLATKPDMSVEFYIPAPVAKEPEPPAPKNRGPQPRRAFPGPR